MSRSRIRSPGKRSACVSRSFWTALRWRNSRLPRRACCARRAFDLRLACRWSRTIALSALYGLASLRVWRVFQQGDIDLLVQVAAQVAIAVENSLAFQEIAELKNKLAQEKLYLEDEIRSEMNFDEIVGEGASLRAVLKQVETVAPTDSTVLVDRGDRHGKGTDRPGHTQFESAPRTHLCQS